MGCLLCCCCCCKTITAGPSRRKSSFSDLDTIRPTVSTLEVVKHSDITSPFLDMNPVLIEASTRTVHSEDQGDNPTAPPAKEIHFANAFVFKSS